VAWSSRLAVQSQIRTPDQRLRVFVSSTLQELAAERDAARSAISSLRLSPVLFELGARPYPPRALYRAYLSQSQVFVGIYWQSYGWVAPGEAISGLEDEYDLAGQLPKLIYVKSPAPEREPRMGALLERIRADDSASYKRFESPEELERLLAEDLALLLTERFVADTRPPDAQSEPDPQPTARTRLPAPTTSLVGRDRERARLRALLLEPDVRLVTLTGPGGVGKTRLALAAATEIRAQFEDNVCLVPLAAIADPALVAASIVQALGLRPGPGHSPLEWLNARLGDRHLLLLLDNFEQVMAAAPDVAQLLESGPRVKALVTSREVLRLRAEYELPLAPLGLPPSDARLFAGELQQHDALRLFLERARATQPEFSLTNENIDAVAEICRRLDGIPLAIELAAARLRVFTPEAMLRRMGWRRLRLLSGGVRDLPERQQTLRGTIDWSYRLLTEPEQRLFARLSVFVGGCGLAAAEVICNPHDDLDVLGGLESLVDKNLVQRSEVDVEEPRFSMLATIREYAAERLDGSGEADDLRRLHANYFLAMLRNAERAMQSSLQPTWLARVERENDNVRAIMRRALRRGDPGVVGRVGSAMWLYWFTTGGTSEGQAWMEEALASPAAMTQLDRARTLAIAGLMAFARGAREASQAMLREAAGLFETLGDRRGLALTLVPLSFVSGEVPDLESLMARLDASIALMREIGFGFGLNLALSARGRLAFLEQDFETAQALLAEAQLVSDRVGDSLTAAMTLGSRGWIAAHIGEPELARDLCARALRLFTSLGSKSGTAFAMEGMAVAEAASGTPTRAISLLAAADALREAAGAPAWPAERLALDRVIEDARTAVGETAFEAAWRAGGALSSADALVYAQGS
jgi:predicted ATPase